MNRTFLCLLLAWAACAESRAQSFSSFLAQSGYAAVPLSQPARNRLALPVRINQKSNASLLIATACPISGLDRAAASRLGVTPENSSMHVRGTLGPSNERYGFSVLAAMSVSGQTLTKVKVAVLNLSNISSDEHFRPPVDGVLGYEEMRRLGAIIDCRNRMLYIHREGAKTNLERFLGARGYTRVSMRLDGGRHFQVGCALNGHGSQMGVDTAAIFTCINPRTAAKAGIASSPMPGMANAAGGRRAAIRAGQARELSIGTFKVTNAPLAVVDGADDSLGIENLLLNSAIIDVEGASVYLHRSSQR